jgi:hypothetical protein
MKSPTLQHVCDMAFVLADKVREDLRRRPSDTRAKRVMAYWFAKAAKSLRCRGAAMESRILAGRCRDRAHDPRSGPAGHVFRKDPEKFAPPC